MAEQKHAFQAEVAKLLTIVAHSLYSEKQIFLRELISNASDACDKLRYAALTNPELTKDEPEFKVVIAADKKARTLTISDNGIGMSRDELVRDLGTIARSGTANFVAGLTGDSKKDMSAIGQFGVGFYSSFMVADRVEVVSRKAGETEAWRWSSDGQGEYTVAEAEKDKRGAEVTLHIKEGEAEFLEPVRLRNIIHTYSDHIALPIHLVEDGKENLVNEAKALWTRPRADITEQQYAEFYRHVAHAMDKPALTLHWKAEGTIEYSALLFVPESRPFDLFTAERQHRAKLYVRRVFITDKCEGLVPPWLRFLRGVIDSEDLPLNISRELLQSNPVVTRIRSQVARRVLSELEKFADKEPESYAAVWNDFGAVLKEGIYEDRELRDDIVKVARFRTTAGDTLASLDDYVGRMKPGQSAIYYITGESLEAVQKSPQLEGFRARGVEVLLLTDPVDEFWVPSVGDYKEKPFKSATKAGADLSAIPRADGAAKPDAPAEADAAGVDALLASFRLTLKDAVKDVRKSDRLTDSPVCLVADESDLDIRLERLLKAHRQLDVAAKRILEVNPAHPLIQALAAGIGKDGAGQRIEDAAWLLLDQARIVEGEPLPDPAAFTRRMSAALQRGLGA